MSSSRTPTRVSKPTRLGFPGTARSLLNAPPATADDDCAALVALVDDLRSFTAAEIAYGIPDESAAATDRRYRELACFRQRLDAIDDIIGALVNPCRHQCTPISGGLS